MPTLTINDQEVTVETGTPVIDAAEKLGIYVPRYCYHPGLSLAGSCRMCLVEIENIPPLQISCYTVVQDGMKVYTDSPRVRQARQAMLEFLLSDHPLDCPVCDQSGECDLQNFYMDFGRYDSRFVENKVKKKKAFQIGPHVMLDQERCILCTRCTRFTEEVSKSDELGVFNRGGRSVIDLYPGKTLDNPYSGNVIDICPVGALTEREFRFQCRVWYLETQDSICNGCARGCNISIHFNTSRSHKAGGKRVMRIKPRHNPEVNKWWICDAGRFGYEFIDQNRIERPAVRGASGLQTVEWEAALETAAQTIAEALEAEGPDSIGVIVSPQLSNEDLLLARELFVEKLKLTNLALENPWEPKGPEDDFLRRADMNPNTRGAKDIGFSGSASKLLEKASEGQIKVLYIFWHSFDTSEASALLENSDVSVIFHGANWNPTAELAHVVLPGVTHAEKDGTFTNFEGRIQRFKQALLPVGEAMADSEILSRLAEKLGHQISSTAPEEAFVQWQGMPYEKLGEFGVLESGESPVQS